MKLLVINGPNINLLGIREPDIYGKEDYEALVDIIEETCEEEDIDVDIFQSNHEGEIIDSIQEAYDDEVDGIVINPAGYTHTSIAIMDALKAVAIPSVEVHISDVRNREDFRQISYAGKACIKTISGMGIKGYREAILFLKNYLDQQI